MGTADTLTRPTFTRPSAGPAVVRDTELDIRWAAWVARGRVHEQRVRRRFLIWAPVIAVAGAIALVLLRS
jgi:hypothetical protein